MQQPNAMYINKIGGEIKFTAEKGLSLGLPSLEDVHHKHL